MGESLGPMVPLVDITDSAYTREICEKEINEKLKLLYAESVTLVHDKMPYLDALATALLEKEVVLGSEIEELFKKVDTEINKVNSNS